MCRKLNIRCGRLICSISFVLVLSVVSSASADLVAHWDLEEGSGSTTTAAVGSPDADGTLVGATWLTTDLAPIARTTAAVFFESVNSDRIETNYVGILGNAARTVTAWIKAEPTQNNSCVIVGWGVNTNTQRYSFRLNKSASDGAVGAIRLEIQGSRVVGTTQINDRQWHHVAVTQRQGARIDEVSFYVDGQLENQSGTSGGGLINTGSSSVVLGNSGHSPGSYGFDGAIDDVRIYSRVLTQEDIQQAMKGVPPGLASDPNPVDKATDVSRDVTLSWTPGEFANT